MLSVVDLSRFLRTYCQKAWLDWPFMNHQQSTCKPHITVHRSCTIQSSAIHDSYVITIVTAYIHAYSPDFERSRRGDTHFPPCAFRRTFHFIPPHPQTKTLPINQPKKIYNHQTRPAQSTPAYDLMINHQNDRLVLIALSFFFFKTCVICEMR